MPTTLITSVCPVTLDARIRGGEAPAILCVRGAWAPRTFMNELLTLYPGVDMVIGDLPGMWATQPEPSDMATFSRAYDEVIAHLLPGRRVVAFGISTGALVTLGLRRPEVRAQVAMEPFLATANLWPLILDMQQRLPAAPEQARRYIFEMFGITETGCEDRDFSPILDGVCSPVHAVLGAMPLEPARLMETWPSLADERTRERLALHPSVTMHHGPPGSGHHVTGTPQGWATLTTALDHALAEA